MRGMDTISALKREDIQRLPGGRISSLIEIDGEPVRLVSSTRRKKTIAYGMRDGVIELVVPSRTPDTEIIRVGRGVIKKVKDQQRRARSKRSDPALYERALHLARVWLGSEVMPSSVVWSDRQTTLWGSCTVSTGAIRISTMLHQMPQWVIDGVLIHELAHLKYANHGQQFKDLTRRYPRMVEVDAFLNGVSFAQRSGQSKTYPNAYD